MTEQRLAEFRKYMDSRIKPGTNYYDPDYTIETTLPHIHNLEEAVEMASHHLLGNKIVIFGDYDADGIMSSGIMVKLLLFITDRFAEVTQQQPSEISVIIPDRERDGYGFSEKYAQQISGSLIFLLDNGIAQMDAIRKAQENGNEVIVLDHHLGRAEENPANIVVDPNAEEHSTFKEYCAAGLTYRFAREMLAQPWAVDLLGENAIANALGEFLFMAAVATVADCVPLVNENRCIVIEGLTHVPSYWEDTVRQICEIQDCSMLTEETINYKMSPTLNAPSRMGKLTTEDVYQFFLDGEDERQRKAKEFQHMNTERKDVTDAGILLSMEKIGEEEMIILQDDSYHQGVVGIIAGILRDRYKRPAVIFGPVNDGVVVGSGRSTDVNLKGMLDYVQRADETILIRYGGHKNAAGCTIFAEKLNAFRKLCLEYYRNNKEEEEEDVCFKLQDGDDWGEIYDVMREYAPFGIGNPAPRFNTRVKPVPGIRLTMGQGDKDVQINDMNGNRVVAFKQAASLHKDADAYEVTGTLSVNNYWGGAAMQFIAESLTPLFEKEQSDGEKQMNAIFAAM